MESCTRKKMGAEQSSLSANRGGDGSLKNQNRVNFFINGQEHNVSSEMSSVDGCSPTSLLVDYIRDEARLKGTKYSCREGGCGACVVQVKTKDPQTGAETIRPVNSCLTPVFSCDGWDITTVEGLGDKRSGYHPIQKRLVSFNGTQCGFCSPGMVMNMHSLMASKPASLTSKLIEDNFDGNICRCTGYRPILDAFKSMAVDASEELKRKCIDMEDIIGSPCPLKSDSCCAKKDKCCGESFEKCIGSNEFHIKFKSGEQWVKPGNLENLFTALQEFTASQIPYKLVAGNTASGVYKNDGPYGGYVDVSSLPELRNSVISQSNVTLGGGVTLNSAIELLTKAGGLDGYEYATQMKEHISRVANVPIRSSGTLAGNLMIKHAHPEFPSDIFLLLETVGAQITIASAPNLQKSYSPVEFLKLDMSGKIILSITLPSLPKTMGYMLRTFKITRRFQNAHAYVNAGFLFKVDSKRNFNVREKPSIVFGGISPDLYHAEATENFFVGKFLGDAQTLSGGIEELEKEIKPDFKPPDAKPEYRKMLTKTLLYKTVLGIINGAVSDKNKSGGADIEHNVTYGRQIYDTEKKEWPINQPVMKLEATVQVSGEAEYVNDIPKAPGELAGAFVLTTVANAKIKNIDASNALKIPGVVSFLTAKDIPGANNYYIFAGTPEEIFVSNEVSCAGWPVGLILATSRPLALKAAKEVIVTYEGVKKPVLTIADALKKAEEQGKLSATILEQKGENPKLTVGEPKHKIKGEFEIGGQYHFQMETQTTFCKPREDGIDVYAATQWIDMTQVAIASMLGIPNNSVNVEVRRLGGGYGSKISKSVPISAACALGSYLTNKPVRIVLDIETNMAMIGKRLPYLLRYEVGFNDEGKIEELSGQLYCDAGAVSNEITSVFGMICMQSCYEADGWKVSPGAINTNTPPNTYCRSPGSTQGFAAIETIMEHIARELKKDPLEVKMANLIKDGDPIYSEPGVKFSGKNFIPDLVAQIKNSADYDERRKFINNFNKTNRWKKRGMGIVPMRYPSHYFSLAYPCFISIYHIDGTVAISHAGIEMGQGINTKVAQVVAHEFKIPLDKIKVKPSNNLVSPNAMVTGGAVTSEIVCYAAIQACKILNGRIEPIRAQLEDKKWENVIAACQKEEVELVASYLPKKSDDIKPYDIWGLNLTEVEVDVLTGEYKIVRVDLIEDAGVSISPEIDIGQVEGSLIMGLGLWTTEKLQYDSETGQLLTTNTWEYKPPLAKDIPEDIRITLLKNAPNPFGVLRSKATGEPPLCMSVCVLFAMRDAIDSARADAGLTDYYQINGPITPEDILTLSGTNPAQFTF